MGSKSSIASSTEAILSGVGSSGMGGPSGDEPVQRHQPCPGAIAKAIVFEIPQYPSYGEAGVRYNGAAAPRCD